MKFREWLSLLYKKCVDFAKKKPTERALKEAMENEGLTNYGLYKLQEKKFKNLIQSIAKSNSFFKNKIEGQDLTPEVIADNKQLIKIPPTTKQEIRDNFRQMRGVPCGKFFEGRTSGSTGVALKFYNDSFSLAWADACKWRGRSWHGASRHSSSLVLWGQPIYLGLFGKMKWNLKNYLHNIRFFNTFENLSEKFLKEVCDCLLSSKPKYIYGYGSSIAALSQFMKRRGIRINYRPMFVQFTADHMSRSERETAEEVFDCQVVSDYGSSEAPGIAEECEYRNLHISIDNYIVEILGEDGSEVPMGSVGEVTITALHAFGFPLVRYRTGDLGRKIEGVCECGRPFPLFHLEAGKAVDLISTSWVANVSAHVLDYINLKLMNENIPGIAQFFLEQISRDGFTLSIVRDEPFYERSVEVFLQELRSYLGAKIDVDVIFVEQIPMTVGGKRRYFGKARDFSSELLDAST